MLLPTPPKETIKVKQNQKRSLQFHELQHQYIIELIEFADSTEFSTLSMAEKVSIGQEIDEQKIAYERLRERIDNY